MCMFVIVCICCHESLLLYVCSIPGEGGMARKVPTKDSSIPKLFGGSLTDYVQVRHFVGTVLNLMCYI